MLVDERCACLIEVLKIAREALAVRN